MADDLTEAKAQGYLRKHMVVRADPATGLPVGGGSLPGDDLAIARAQGYLNRHMVVLADPVTGLPVGGAAMAGDDLAVAKQQGYLYHHMTVDADPATGLPIGGGSLPGDDLAEARRNGYLHRHMVVLVDPVTGLPVGGGALPGDDLVQAKTQGYLHRHMILDTDPVTGLPVPPTFVPNAVDFSEATPDYLTRATDLIGNVDAYTGVISFWVRRDGTATEDTIIANAAIPFRVRFLSTSTLGVTLVNDTSTAQLTFTSTPTFPASPVWRWFGISWNTNFAAGLKVIHVWNDAGIVAGSKSDTAAAFLVDYTRVGWAVAAQFGGSQSLDGALAEVFFAPGQFLDFSVLSNREKFIKDGKPVSLGANGSTPLGAVPKVYLKNPAASAGVNSGSGGDFTIVGAPAVASSNPSDPSPIQQYLDRMTVAPSGAVQTAITNFINGLWADGVYQKIDAMWLMNLHTEQASRLNLMSANHTLVNVGVAPAWVSGVGGAGGFTASTAALTTEWAPLANGLRFTQDSAHMAIRSWTDAQGNNHDAGNSSRNQFILRSLGNTWTVRMNASVSQSAASTTGIGLFAADRADAAGHSYYRGGALLETDAQVSIAPLSVTQIHILGGNGATIGTRRCSFFSLGASLGTAGQLALFTRLTAFEAAIGAT